MLLQKSKSTLINVLIQILIWIVLGNVLLFYQPFFGDIAIPYQFWIKQTFIFGLLIGAYYLNAHVLVPKLLLKKQTGLYFLIVAIIILGIMFFGWLRR